MIYRIEDCTVSKLSVLLYSGFSATIDLFISLSNHMLSPTTNYLVQLTKYNFWMVMLYTFQVVLQSHYLWILV